MATLETHWPEPNLQEPLGNLLLLTKSGKWGSAIQRSEWHPKVHWALDLDDLFQMAARRCGSVAVVEIEAKEAVQTCADLVSRDNPAYDLALVAVGDYRLAPWLPLLRASSCTLVLHSTTEIQRLHKLAKRHFCKRKPLSASLEERIESELPWKPITK